MVYRTLLVIEYFAKSRKVITTGRYIQVG